jgi:hypothetical protein
MPNYGYFLPLAENLFTSVKFLDLSPKTELKFGEHVPKLTKEGTPQFVLTALVKYGDDKPQTEVFTITLDEKTANHLRGIPELSPIRLIGLKGGKWSRQESDQTNWSFQISSIEVLK